MGVDFGGADVLVAEHNLDGAQGSTALEQVGGEGVAEGVGRNGFVDAGGGHMQLDVVKHRDAREVASAASGDEKHVLVFGFHGDVRPRIEPVANFVHRPRRNGDDALLVALADDAHKAFVEKEVGEAQRTHLAHAQTAAVEQFDQAVIAQPLGRGEVDGVEDALHLLEREHLGQVLGQARRGEQFGGVVAHVALDLQVAIEGAHAADHARQGAGGDAGFEEAVHVVFEQRQVDIEHIDSARMGIVQKAAQIAGVGLAGVGRKALFEQEILFVVVEQFGVHRQASQVLNDGSCARRSDFVFLRANVRRIIRRFKPIDAFSHRPTAVAKGPVRPFAQRRCGG